jgi:16S rRNA (cytosine967-C5)-methyltransferase
MNIRTGAKVRACAAEVIAAVASDGQSLDRCLAKAAQTVELRDRALLSELCYGTLRGYFRYDAILKPLLKKPLKRKDADVRALLLLGCHQLLGMRTADHAAVNTVVECAAIIGKPWARGLLNAILREIQRQRATVESCLPVAGDAGMPEWLHRTLVDCWPRHMDQIVGASNAHPPMYLRVNPIHHTADEYLILLGESDIEAERVVGLSQALRLVTPVNVDLLPGFDHGWVSVQDASAQLAAELLTPASGERVLDACAAPGGKACGLLEKYPGIDLTCLDSDEGRLTLVQENLERGELSAEIIAGDASDPDTWWNGELFDHILIDAPCSGTGVIRRHPDIRLLRREQDIRKLSALQKRILLGLWPLLRPGGTLLYATCSIIPAENSDNVVGIIESLPGAREQKIQAEWGQEQIIGRQLLPDLNAGDGFFYALLTKALQSAD